MEVSVRAVTARTDTSVFSSTKIQIAMKADAAL